MSNVVSFVEVVRDIANWSRRNFGDQEGDGLKLGRVAPLLGAFEEVYEFYTWSHPSDLKDALADIGIYLIDYMSRCGMEAEEIARMFSCATIRDDTPSLYILGKLAKIELKRVQGIRGYDDTNFYEAERKAALERVLSALQERSVKHTSTNILNVVRDVWLENVSKRNWLENRIDGVGTTSK